MKRLIAILATLAAGLFINSYTRAQSSAFVNVRFNVRADTTTMVAYPMPPDSSIDRKVKTIVLNMNYNGSTILNPAGSEVLNTGLCNILSIDMVYTSDDNEELMETLNKRRLFELYLLAPDIFNRSMVKWRFVKQTGEGKNIRKLFHGFVIRYREIKRYNPTSVATMKKDIEELAAHSADNDLFGILQRIPDIEHQAIVVDFTGSMSPYYTELMSWFYFKKYNSGTSFVFFNDGDSKKDSKKVVGKTGGLYSFTTNNLDTILQQALKTVAGGYGGDSPENDAEAILQAIQDNPKATRVVLVADNWADMRDYSLISLIKKPVSVILCGTENGINTQYLDLARVTGGSLHTIEQDIEDLRKVSEGHEVKVGRDSYIYSGGRFRKK